MFSFLKRKRKPEYYSESIDQMCNRISTRAQNAKREKQDLFAYNPLMMMDFGVPTEMK